MRARLLGGNDDPVGDAGVVFEPLLYAQIEKRLRASALQTPVIFTDRLNNRVLAGCLCLREGAYVIAVNVRFKIDPEILAHTLIEEFVHVRQALDGADFEEQKCQFPYAERPYEIEAKQFATELLGYEPENYEAHLLREEPPDRLYDEHR